VVKQRKQETQLSLTNRATHLEILTFEKYRDLETGVRGHWRSSEMSLFDTAHVTSYWCSVVTMALSVVSFLRYSMSKNVVTLKSAGPRSLKVI